MIFTMAKFPSFALLLSVLQIAIFLPICLAKFVREEADFAEVRPGAHLFWLLQYTTHEDGYLNRPLVIWIQGGPGVSGTAYGNYWMFGPEDIDGNPRSTAWVHSASIIYVDSPISTGFSYVDEGGQMPTNIHEIADDLVRFTKIFLYSHPEFEKMPLYIIGQSYGGKMGPAFAYYLNKAQLNDEIRCDLRAVAIGNGYVSPYDIDVGVVEMMYQMSLMDLATHDMAVGYLDEMSVALQNNNSEQYAASEQKYRSTIPAVSSYNIIEDPRHTSSMYTWEIAERIQRKMDGDFRAKFKSIPDDVEFSSIFQRAFGLTDLSDPIYDLIDDLLYESDVQVIVYSGQYDVICLTSGQEAWIKRLTWPGIQAYHEKKRVTLYAPDSEETEMFVKATDRFKFYWVLKSGHGVPLDVPEVGLRMLNRILDDADV